MVNDFDFYVVKAISNKKTPMKNAGFKKEQIKSTIVGRKNYGYKSYPVVQYSAIIGHAGPNDREGAEKIAESYIDFPEIKVAISYIAT